MNRSLASLAPQKAAMARAVMAAAEPLVEILLDLGVTSPEAESLFRSMFVHTARAWLSRQSDNGHPPSATRVALVSGVHRNFVRELLAQPPRIASARELKGHRANRLLRAWHTDGRYLDNSGKPRDLAERGSEPSFHTLATTYARGIAPTAVLDELKRAGAVQLLPDRRVRIRAKWIRFTGSNANSLSELGALSRGLIATMAYNLRHPEARRYCDSVPTGIVEEGRLAAFRNLAVRRAEAFLATIEHDLAAESRKAQRSGGKRVKVGFAVFEMGETASV